MLTTPIRIFNEAFNAIGPLYKRIQTQRLFLILALITFLSATSWLFHSSRSPNSLRKPIAEISNPNLSPLPKYSRSVPHPIRKLIESARADFAAISSRQSRTLTEAVTEYSRRYKIPPPPHFDKWYDFVVRNNVQLTDEYDGIFDALLPFWGMSPRAIRTRVKRAMGSNQHMTAMFIRDGKVVKTERGAEWRQKGVLGMMGQFVQYLPDMDLAFNLHDEGRVVLPTEDLSRLVRTAKTDIMPKSRGNKALRNSWSSRPGDLNDGHIEPYNISPFNEYAHQFTWTIARLSCPVDSPARLMDYQDEKIPDQTSAYAVHDLGFIYNRTAFTDICLSPSLAETFGFFNRPNAWDVTHDLVPIFSASKVSSFQDIRYPSPWYWTDQVFHNDTRDRAWDKKLEKVYWRGTTTSGYSRDGSWHRQHRQRFIEKINKPGISKVLEYQDRDGNQKAGWQVKKVPQEDFNDLFDVHFTFVGQCEEKDCEVQRNYFNIYNDTDFQEAWENKYLLDIDGNAFSGRFYTFLQSNSLAFKLALFREWHEEWLKPWVHYVPLSVKGDEHLEVFRYFSRDEEGRILAKQIADDSRRWAQKVLRHVDMEAWFFRLMLEYGRVIDDDRDIIGYQVS